MVKNVKKWLSVLASDGNILYLCKKIDFIDQEKEKLNYHLEEILF